MAVSEAQVVNLALLRVGERQTIDNLNENTTPAKVAKQCWALVRDEVLTAAPWSFAAKERTLALTTETRNGWGYCYALPTDCAPDSPKYLWNGNRAPQRGDLIPFDVCLNDAGGGHLLCTDREEAVLCYTALIENPSLWGKQFVNALAWRLAVEFALSIPVQPGKGQLASGAYAAAVQQAWAADANGRQEDEEAESEFITERG